MPRSACCASAKPSANVALTLADAGHADGHGRLELGLRAPKACEQRFGVRGGELDERAQRVLAMVEERARGGDADRALERLGAGLRDEDDVRLVEVATEASGAPFEVAARTAAGELLEEVLDQVLLGELLDDLRPS